MPKPFTTLVLASAVIAGGVAAASAVPAGAAERPARPSAAVEVRPRPDRPEHLRLACQPASDGEQRGIGCRWSPSTSRRFAGYRLVRGTPDGREVVFRTADRAHTRFLDTNVRPGVRYRYAVVAVDAAGHIVGRSSVVTTGIPPASQGDG